MLGHAAVDGPTGDSAADCASSSTEYASANDLRSDHRAGHAASHEAGGAARTATIFMRVVRPALVVMSVVVSRGVAIGGSHDRYSARRKHSNSNRNLQTLEHLSFLCFVSQTSVAMDVSQRNSVTAERLVP